MLHKQNINAFDNFGEFKEKLRKTLLFRISYRKCSKMLRKWRKVHCVIKNVVVNIGLKVKLWEAA